MTIILKNKETLQYKSFYFRCAIGKKGLTSLKKEGDKRSNARLTKYLGSKKTGSVYIFELDKKYDIMLGGCLSPEYYPLRVRFANILKRMSGKYRTHIHQHPGYNLQDAHTNKYLIDLSIIGIKCIFN